MVGGEGRCVEVINFTDGGEGDEANDNVDRVAQRTEENDAEYLSCKTTNRLHEGDKEGVEWIREVFRVICHVLHHLKSLTHVTFHLQVHEDRADEASAEDIDRIWQDDVEAFRVRDNDDIQDGNEHHLN